MANLSRSPSDAHMATNGPSRSVLQQLLEEINGYDAPTEYQKPPSSQGTPKSTSRSSSVWVAGSSNAQEARAKLRAADEARQRRMSTPTVGTTADSQEPLALRRHSTQGKMPLEPFEIGIWKPPQLMAPFLGNGLNLQASSKTDSPTSLAHGNMSRGIMPPDYGF